MYIKNKFTFNLDGQNERSKTILNLDRHDLLHGGILEL